MTNAMALQILTEERLAQATRRLLVASDDLIACGARLAGSGVRQTGTQAHRELFASYLSALRPVVAHATDWWFEAMAFQTAQTGDASRARQVLLKEYPAGPASQGQVVQVVRHHWLACDKLNAGPDTSRWIDPPKLLLGWLRESGNLLCVEVIASQPYWPVCLTKQGAWF